MPSPLSAEDQISNLKDLNGTLLKQVSAYRLSNSDLQAKVKSLEERVHELCARVDGVSLEKSLAEEERHRVEQELVYSKKEVARLGLERDHLVKDRETLNVNKEKLEASLLESEEERRRVEQELMYSKKEVARLGLEKDRVVKDRQTLNVSKEKLEASLLESEEERRRVEQELMYSKKEAARLGLEKDHLVKDRETLNVSKEKLEASLRESEEKIKLGLDKHLQSQQALVLAEEKCHKHQLEITALINERDLLLSEISNLRTANDKARASLAVLSEKEKGLENQIREMREGSETQANEAKIAIQSLRSELADRLKEREGFQMQLKEAWDRIASLEIQRKETMSWQKSLESRSKALELDLLRAQEEHSKVLESLSKERDSEKLDFESMLELANAKVRLLEQELDSIKISLSSMDSESCRNRAAILQLETERSSLVQEKETLQQAKSSLEEQVENLKSSCEKVAYEAKNEIGIIESRFKALQLDLIKAREEHTAVLDSLIKERELEKVSLENMVEVANAKAEGLDQELNSVKRLLSTMEIESEQLKKKILQHETGLSILAQEKETLKEAKSLREEEIINLKCSHDKLTIELKNEMGKLERQFEALELEYKAARVEHVNLLDSIMKEKESEKVSLESKLEVANSKSWLLEDELNVARGHLSTLEVESARDRERILQFEMEHSALTREKEDLEVSKSSLEDELEHWKASCEEVASEATRNAEKLEAVIAKLESSLSEARECIFQREKSVCQLEGDLQELNFHIRKREKLMFMSLPLALASTGSLIGVGIAALLRHAKHAKY